MKLYFDFETTSDLDLKIVGLDNYARHLSTQVLCMGYAFDGQPAQSWEPHLEPMPTELREALTDPTILKLAWNVSFELNILASVLHIEIPLTQFFDPMAHARYISLPGSLGDCGDVLKINAGKDKDGKRLMKMFQHSHQSYQNADQKGHACGLPKRLEFGP
jgi:DNA polymerase